MSSHVVPAVTVRPFSFHGDVTAVVSTRHGGVSTGAYASLNVGDHVGDDHEAVLENRRRLCAALGAGSRSRTSSTAPWWR